MRTLIIALAAFPLLAGAPAVAQEHEDHHPATETAAAAKPMSEMSDAEMHAHCQGLMGRKMKGRTRHDHSAEKLGHAPPPPTPPSQAEMKQMHDKCAAMMAQGSAGLKPK